MSQELIYTSAPKGLKLGSRGFCTVASTTGMAKNLADRLEALTGYKHLFPPDSPQAFQNPVNYSYLRFALGGQTYYVLSRIADAGLDYTQRSNKIAHHLALSHSELVAAGPAWLASQPGVFETAWSKDPQLLAQGRLLPTGEIGTGICKSWQAIAGDAGWAGVLAEHAVKNSSDEAYLVYKPGTDVLRLLLEAQSLLPSEVRWNTTFSTYFTKLPPGIECRWRGVVEGTPESLRVRRLPNTLVIDITKVLPTPTDGPLVAAARSANPTDRNAIRGNVQVNEQGSRTDRSEHDIRMPGQVPSGKSNTPRHTPTGSKPPALPGQRNTGWISTYTGAGLSRRERAMWIASIMIVVAAFTGILIYLTRSPIEIPELVQKSSSRDIRDIKGPAVAPPKVESNSPEASKVNDEPKQVQDESPSANDTREKDERNNIQSPDLNPIVPEPATPPTVPQPLTNEIPKTWDDVLEPNTFQSEVSLPVVPLSDLNPKWNTPKTLAVFRVDKPRLELDLFVQDANNMNAPLTLVAIPRTSGPTPTAQASPQIDPPDQWQIHLNQSGGQAKRLAKIGFNQSDPGTLEIQWDKDARNVKSGVTDVLRESVLRMHVSGTEKDQARLIAFKPSISLKEPRQLNADKLVKGGEWECPLDDARIPEGQEAAAYFRVSGSQLGISKTLSLSPGESSLLTIGKPPLAQILAKFTIKGGDRPSLVLKLYRDNESESKDELFPEWYSRRINERRIRLEEAINVYVRTNPSFWLSWNNRFGVPVDFPTDQDGVGNITKRYPPKIGDLDRFLSAKELTDLVDLENWMRDDMSTEKLPRPQYEALKQHIHDYPTLANLPEEVRRAISDVALDVRVTRTIEKLDKPRPAQQAEVDVFVAGRP